MADIKQLLQQMMASPDRALARSEQQQFASLMRIFKGTVAGTQTQNSLPSAALPTTPPTTTQSSPAHSTQPVGANTRTSLLVSIHLLVSFLPAKGEQPPRIQGNNWQWPNPPKALQPSLTQVTKMQLTVTQPNPERPVLRLTLSQGHAGHKPVATVDMNMTQLPPKLVTALIQNGQVTTSRPQATGLTSAVQRPEGQTSPIASPGMTPTAPAKSTEPSISGLAIKQAQQLTPKQFQQALQALIKEATTSGPSLPSPPLRPELTGDKAVSEAIRNAQLSPPKALQQLVLKTLQQMPTAESMQKPEALKHWVSDWFSARPVSPRTSQHMGGLGQMLMTLLGVVLQQKNASAPSTATSPSLNALPRQWTQALIQQVLSPQQDTSGEVRERINTLLQQLPQQQLQRLLQLFTGVLNSAQSSQARLQDSVTTQPEYYILLPVDSQKPQQQELLIRREEEPSSGDKPGRTLWLFTLRFELERTGPILVKGRYHPQGSSVDFYTETPAAQRIVERQMDVLENRLNDLDVTSVKFRVQQGKIPDNLAQHNSGIIRVTV